MNNLEMEAVKRVASLPYDWSRFNNKVLLISGGTGFIGSFLIEVLRHRTNYFGNTIKIVSLSRREECPMIIWRIWRSMSAIR